MLTCFYTFTHSWKLFQEEPSRKKWKRNRKALATEILCLCPSLSSWGNARKCRFYCSKGYRKKTDNLTYINKTSLFIFRDKEWHLGIRMAAWRLITVLPNILSRFDRQIKCAKCGQTLSVGAKAWAHACPRKRCSYTEYYCLLCFEEIWL